MDTIFSRGFDYTLRYNLRDYGKGDMLPLVSDTMFHIMLNNESKKKYVAYFLSLIFDKDYQSIYDSIKYEKTELDKDNYHSSKETVDLVCTVDGIIYNVEMNNNPDLATLERNIGYTLGLFKGSMHRGDDYNYNHVIQININNFNFIDNDKAIDEVYLKTEDSIILTDKIKFIFIYLPLIRKKLYNKSELNTLEKLLLTFNEKSSKVTDKIFEGDLIMEEYREDAYNSSQRHEILGLYDKEKEKEMLDKIRLNNATKEGFEQGIEQGIETTKKQAAINLINNGVPLEIISKSLDMNLNELEKLK